MKNLIKSLSYVNSKNALQYEKNINRENELKIISIMENR